MRRKEFSVNEEHKEDVEQFISEMKYGVLALQGETYPVVIPLNYIYVNGAFYFHGSKAGEKMKTLKTISKATFVISQEYAQIPSYLENPYFACPATVFFKSVVIRGAIYEVTDEQEKHVALDALMRKLQPEGGYSPIIYEDESYHKQVKATAVLKLEVDEKTSKFKFGQNWKEEKIKKVTSFLASRNDNYDAKTIELMEKYCPHYQNKQ